MSELDLQRALGGASSAAEDFQDESGAVDHLAAKRPLKISLLRRRQGAVEDHKMNLLGFDFGGYGLDLALADVSRRPDIAQRHCLGADHDEVDSTRQSDCLVASRAQGSG